MKPVVVTDVRYRMSLPVIRSLGKEKIPVVSAERAGSDKNKALGFYSKYSTENIFLADAEKDSEAFFNELEAFSKSQSEKPVIIPIGISTLLAMCAQKERVSQFADAALPPLDSIELANDKSRLIPFAKDIGIPVPETLFINDGETIEAFANRISYPAVIKLPRGEMLGLSPDERYKIVKCRNEFIAFYEKFSKLDDNILVQKYISGDGYGVSAVFGKNCEPIEIFCHHRIREYPASGGPSCFCESAALPELADYAIKLLRALRWEGVAMVEFKGNPKDGFYLMEINPRFWGSSGLAPNSGCNIAKALYRAAQGEEAAPYSSFAPNYKVGHKMRFLLQDLLSFSAYLKKSKNKPLFAIKFLLGLLNPRISDGVLNLRDWRSSLKYLSLALKKKDSIVR